MRKVLEIYSEYKIMPTLQAHQLRVATVSKVICDRLDINNEDVILACLFHDMGNIIKFDLSYFPDFVQPEGMEYWQGVKNQFIEKYGNEEHFATEAIAREIELPERAFQYLHNIGFPKLEEVLKNKSLEQMVCSYSDMRVGPRGIISIAERLTDGRKRYKGKRQAVMGEKFEILGNALQQIENLIFSNTSTKPDTINDDLILTEIEKLKNY